MARPSFRRATEEQIACWIELVDKGVKPFEAAQMAGTTLTQIGRTGDGEAHRAGMEMAKEKAAAKVEKRIEELVMKDDPSPAIAVHWAKANHPDYADRSQVEVTGRGGGPITVEGRALVGFRDVIDFARKIGAADQLGISGGEDPGNALPAPRKVLPDPGDDEPPAGLLPAA
jgi:hypothetical protein